MFNLKLRRWIDKACVIYEVFIDWVNFFQTIRCVLTVGPVPLARRYQRPHLQQMVWSHSESSNGSVVIRVLCCRSWSHLFFKAFSSRLLALIFWKSSSNSRVCSISPICSRNSFFFLRKNTRSLCCASCWSAYSEEPSLVSKKETFVFSFSYCPWLPVWVYGL